MSNDKDFLGKGFRFPVAVNLNGGVSASALEENVRQSIFIILGTAPGERLNRPTFGCRIHDLMFAPNNDITAARAEVYCEEAIYKFEPRIEKVVCRAGANPDAPNRLDVKLEYVIAGKHEKRNLVFPFYLRTDEELAGPLENANGASNGVRPGANGQGNGGSNGTNGI